MPPGPDPTPAFERRDTVRRSMKPLRNRRGELRPVTLCDLLEEGLLADGEELVWHRPRHPNDAAAFVTGNGRMRMDGEEFATLSMAARAVSHSPCNGWAVWRRAS